MTDFRISRSFGPALAVLAALGAGSAEAKDAPIQLSYQLCELPDPLPAWVKRQLPRRADFADLLLYASKNCPDVGLRLTDSTTAWLPPSAPATEGGNGGGDEEIVSYRLCDLPTPLPAWVQRQVPRRADFADLLRYASENCPEVALLLTDSATASIPEVPTDNDNGPGGRDGEGGQERPGGGGGDNGGGNTGGGRIDGGDTGPYSDPTPGRTQEEG